MPNIQVHLSQAVVTQNNLDHQKSSGNGSLASFLDSVLKMDYAVASSYNYASSYSSAGSTFRMNYSNGASVTYSGVTPANPNASAGTATVNNVNFTLPGSLSISQAGSFNYNYQINGNAFSLATSSGTISAYGVQTLGSAGSSTYDPVLGKVSLAINGAITYDANHNLGGTISQISTSATSYAKSSTILGNFNVHGNSLNIGQGLSGSVVSGVMTGYSENYYDGSWISISGLGSGLAINNQEPIDFNLLSKIGTLAGNDVISVILPKTIYTATQITTGSGTNTVTMQGGGQLLSFAGGSGNDTVTVLDHNHSINGGGGSNTVTYQLTRASQIVTTLGSAITVADSTGTDTLTNVQRIQFSDQLVAYDISPTQTAGSVYMLYQATFNRKPDAAGLGYWINAVDKGADITKDVAAAFVKSGEFVAKYGANPTNASYVDNLYQNVLHRAGDAGGVAYWNKALNDGVVTKAAVLEAFATLPEGASLVAADIAGGIAYTQWVG